MKNKDNNKKIYIILTYSGTFLAKIIKFYTGANYCHVSIALDESLNEMYSFGRLKPYNPFIGGFVHEGIDRGTFKRFKNTKALIYSLEIDKNKFKKMKRIIAKMKKNKENYKFNTIGLFAAGFNIKYERENYFYCAEFIKYLIDESKLSLELPKYVKPIDFKDNKLLQLKYNGLLRDYCINN